MNRTEQVSSRIHEPNAGTDSGTWPPITRGCMLGHGLLHKSCSPVLPSGAWKSPDRLEASPPAEAVSQGGEGQPSGSSERPIW